MSSDFFDIRGKELLEVCPDGVDPILWDEFRFAMKKANQYEEQESGPIQIDLELNGTCNMECPFCIHGYGEQTGLDKHITLDQAKDILRQAHKSGCYSLKLNYINEPLLRNDLEDIISYARQIGFVNVYFVTNGLLLTETRSRSILLSGLTRIGISIDAATAEIYDKQRRNGFYNDIVKNVKFLIQLRNEMKLKVPLIRVSFLKNNINIHESVEFFNQWKTIADIITFQTMNELPSHSTGLTLESFENPKSCDFPFKQLVIDHEGNILPCCKLSGRNLKIGTIDSMSIQQAWKSDKMQELRSLHKENRWHENPVCKACLTNK